MLTDPHAGTLGLRFYTGKTFPAQYQGAIFIAPWPVEPHAEVRGRRRRRVARRQGRHREDGRLPDGPGREHGSSSLPLTPSLGGQPSLYATTQLFLFREGRRNDHPLGPAMAAQAKGMSNDDLRGHPNHIATLPAPTRRSCSAAARWPRNTTAWPATARPDPRPQRGAHRQPA